MSDNTMRAKMTSALLHLWYLNSDVTQQVQKLQIKDDGKITELYKEKLDAMDEQSFLELYNQSLKRFYEL